MPWAPGELCWVLHSPIARKSDGEELGNQFGHRGLLRHHQHLETPRKWSHALIVAGSPRCLSPTSKQPLILEYRRVGKPLASPPSVGRSGVLAPGAGERDPPRKTLLGVKAADSACDV